MLVEKNWDNNIRKNKTKMINNNYHVKRYKELNKHVNKWKQNVKKDLAFMDLHPVPFHIGILLRHLFFWFCTWGYQNVSKKLLLTEPKLQNFILLCNFSFGRVTEIPFPKD